MTSIAEHSSEYNPSQDLLVKFACADLGAVVVGVSDVAPVQNTQPVSTDRRVEFHHDWLTVSVWASVEFVGRWFVEQMMGMRYVPAFFEDTGHGARFFKRLYTSPLTGARLYTEHVSGGEFVSLEVPGSALENVPLDKLYEALEYLRLHEVKFKCSRTDLAFDTELLTPEQVKAAILANNMRTLVKREGENVRIIEQPFGGGYTVYLGSRDSERMLRVYRKFKEDGTPYTRVELECKGDRAFMVLCDLVAQGVEGCAARAMAHLRDFVDFFEDWWEAFTSAIPRAKMIISRLVVRTVEQVRDWLRRQVAPSLAMLRKLDAGDMSFLYQLYQEGGDRLSPKYKALLAAAGVA